MFGSKKLSRAEQDRALDKIRTRYDHLITSYMKPISIKHEFEQRFSQALRSRMDIEIFINGEILLLQELFQKEEALADQNEELQHHKEQRRKKFGPGGYAQKVVEDLDKLIEKYPALKVHPHAANEVKRLFGALKDFEENFWHPLEAHLTNVFPSERNGALAQMDHAMWQCTHSRNGKTPVLLERYVMMLDSSDLYGDLLQESQNCIKEAAFLLHDLKNAIEAGFDLGYEDERMIITKDVITKILSDFRLKDIKKKRGEQLWQK